jgi:hypothetical protein
LSGEAEYQKEGDGFRAWLEKLTAPEFLYILWWEDMGLWKQLDQIAQGHST